MAHNMSEMHASSTYKVKIFLHAMRPVIAHVCNGLKVYPSLLKNLKNVYN